MSTPDLDGLRVFVFPSAWGLPTTGPFALKLETWLRLAGIPYERVEEGNPGKGPKGKNPWIELEGERIGDSGIIINLLGERAGVDLDGWLDPQQRPVALAMTRMAEEHLHQIVEYELFILEEGFSELRRMLRQAIPAPVAAVVGGMMRKHFRKQLHARGVARHAPDEIARQGRADLDAIATQLGDKPWLFGDRPTVADCAVLGQVGILTFAPFDTPVARHAKSLDNVRAWCTRVRDELFGADGAGAGTRPAHEGDAAAQVAPAAGVDLDPPGDRNLAAARAGMSS